MTTFLHSFRELLDFGRVITKNLLDLRHFFIYRILKNTNWVMYITKNFFFWTHGTNWERPITRTVCKDIRISEILNIWTFRWPLDRVVCFFCRMSGRGSFIFQPLVILSRLWTKRVTSRRHFSTGSVQPHWVLKALQK